MSWQYRNYYLIALLTQSAAQIITLKETIFSFQAIRFIVLSAHWWSAIVLPLWNANPLLIVWKSALRSATLVWPAAK